MSDEISRAELSRLGEFLEKVPDKYENYSLGLDQCSDVHANIIYQVSNKYENNSLSLDQFSDVHANILSTVYVTRNTRHLTIVIIFVFFPNECL